jgi:subtilisin family serine protease
MIQNCLRFLIVCLGILTINAQDKSPWINVDGYDAHSTHILARFKAPAATPKALNAQQTAVLKNAGLAVVKGYSAHPGLVVLDNVEQPFAPRGGYQPINQDPVVKLKEKISLLKDSGLFHYVQPDYVYRRTLDATDPSYVDETMWGHKNTGQAGGVVNADSDIDLAWDLTTGSKDVLVAVIDTGVRYTHQDLAEQMWVNAGEIPDNGVDDDLNGWIDDIHGINALVDSGDPLDVDDHGTGVAGVIGAQTNDVGIVGVNWDVQIMGCKFLGAFGGLDSDGIECIDYAVEMGAHIINASWGGGPFSQALFDSIANAQNNGVLFVAAAGNDGLNTDIFPHFPSNYELDNIISVGAMDRFDRLANFSNYGNVTVDIVAPGVEIYTTGSGDIAGAGNTVPPDEDYDFFDGTSFSAPYVAGVAALVKSLFPDSQAREIKKRILSSAVPAPAYSSKVGTNGRLNAFEALNVQPDGVLEVTVIPPSQSVLLLGTTQTFVVRVTDLVGVRDATVTGTLSDGQTIVFANDGVAPDVKADDALYTADVALPGNPGVLELVVKAEAPSKQGVEVVLTYTLVTPPPNDDFEDSIKVAPTGAQFVTNNQFASMEENEPQHGGFLKANHSLWWSWSPEITGPAIIDTAGSSFDTIIAVYTGNTLETLQLVASVDNTDGRKDGYLFLDVEEGQSLRIAIAAHDEGEGGSLRLRIRPNGTPDELLPVVRITAPSDGLITTDKQIVISGFAFDPLPNASGIQQVVLRVNGEISGGTAKGIDDWETIAFLKPGDNRIQAQAVDFAGNRSEVSTVIVSYVIGDPANDHMHNATLLTGESGEIDGDNTEATRQFGEPFHAGNAGGGSVWYRIEPTVDGELEIATRRPRFDTLLALYTGEKIAELTKVASNDDSSSGTGSSRIVQALSAGTNYWIAVDGFGGERGQFDLRYAFTPTGVSQLNLLTTSGGSVDGPSGAVTTGSEITLTAVPDFGFGFIGWEGSVESTENPLTITIDSNMEITAKFAVASVSDSFESGGSILPLEFAGTPWSVTDEESFIGDYSLRSGQIGDGEFSSVSLREAFSGGRGKFDLKVSTEEGWDLLTFFVDGKVFGEWSGSIDWQRFEFVLSEGEHVLEWVYRKDFSNSDGMDAVFIDNLDLPIESAQDVENVDPVVIANNANGQLNIEIQGAPNTTYVIEASGNLLEWQPAFKGTTDAQGRIIIRNTSSSSRAQSFFRAVVE